MFVWLVFFNKDFLSNFLMNSRVIDVAKAAVVYMVNQVDFNTKVSGLFPREAFFFFGKQVWKFTFSCFGELCLYILTRSLNQSE